MGQVIRHVSTRGHVIGILDGAEQEYCCFNVITQRVTPGRLSVFVERGVATLIVEKEDPFRHTLAPNHKIDISCEKYSVLVTTSPNAVVFFTFTPDYAVLS